MGDVIIRNASASSTVAIDEVEGITALLVLFLSATGLRYGDVMHCYHRDQ